MRIYMTFSINISENFNFDEIKQTIFDTFKQDFDVIFQGKKIKQGQEFNKLNLSKDSKFFLMFNKFKTNKADSHISAPKTSEKSIDQTGKTNSTNPVTFQKTSWDENQNISKAKDIEKSSTSKMQGNQESETIEADQLKKKPSQKTASKAQKEDNQDLYHTETDEGEASQSEDSSFPGTNLSIKQMAIKTVWLMADDSESREAIFRIGKNPSLYDKIIEKNAQDSNAKLIFTICKFEIIKLCQEQLYRSIFNQESEEIEQLTDKKPYCLDYKNIDTLHKSGEKEKALDLCNKCIKMSPEDGVFHSLKVTFLIDLGRNEEAFDAYNEATKINAPPINLYSWRCKMLYHIGRKAEALAIANEGIFNWPNDVDLLVIKGKILYDLNEKEEAIKFFILAFKVDATYSATNFKEICPDANKIFLDQFPSFSIKKGQKCDICNLIFTGNDTQYLCLYCEPSHYHCDNCEKTIKDNVRGSAKFSHPHSTFVIHPKTRRLNKLKFGASTHENIEFPSDQEDKNHNCICDNTNSGYCDGKVEGNRYKCAHCIDFDLCEGCQNKFLEDEMKTTECLKNSGHKIWHVMIKIKIPSETTLKVQKENNPELYQIESGKGEAIQLENSTFPGSNISIKQAALDCVCFMAIDSEKREAILEIGKDPNSYDKIIEKVLQDWSWDPIFTICKSEIIKLCQEQLYRSIFNQEAKEIEQMPDKKPYTLDYKNIEALYNSGEKEKALDFCNKGIKISPEDTVFPILKVTILIKLFRNEEAFDAYNEAIKINTFLTNLYSWRSQILKLMGRKVEALSVLDEGIFNSPNQVDLLFIKGEILYDLNEKEEAIKFFILAFKVDATYAATNFKKICPDANKIFLDQFPGFSINKGQKCDICNLIFTGNDTQYLCLYCEPSHYHCDNCEKTIKDNVTGSAKFSHPHSTFVIHPKTRQLDKLKFGASTHENIEFPSDQEEKSHTCICDNTNSGYCDGKVEGNRYKCAHCIDFDLCEGCQNKFLEGEMKTMDCLKNSGHKISHVMIKMKIP